MDDLGVPLFLDTSIYLHQVSTPPKTEKPIHRRPGSVEGRVLPCILVALLRHGGIDVSKIGTASKQDLVRSSEKYYCCQNGFIFPRVRDENSKKYLKPAARDLFVLDAF